MLGKLAVFCSLLFLGFALLRLFNAGPAQEQATIVDGPAAIAQKAHKAAPTLRMETNPFTGSAVSDGRTYSVNLIDANKNAIPTGTELFVQGTMYSATWTQADNCT